MAKCSWILKLLFQIFEQPPKKVKNNDGQPSALHRKSHRFDVHESSTVRSWTVLGCFGYWAVTSILTEKIIIYDCTDFKTKILIWLLAGTTILTKKIVIRDCKDFKTEMLIKFFKSFLLIQYFCEYHTESIFAILLQTEQRIFSIYCNSISLEEFIQKNCLETLRRNFKINESTGKCRHHRVVNEKQSFAFILCL